MAIDQALREKLDSSRGAVKARAAEITEQVEAKRKEIAERSAKMREENEKLSKELDKRVEDKKAAKDDPYAKNAWAQKEHNDSMLAFGRVNDDDVDEQPIAPSPPPTLHPAPKPTAPSGRHALADDDDDDFGTQSWLR